LVSSGDAHPENDPEFQRFPSHCLRGTPGAKLIPEALTNDVVAIPNDVKHGLPSDVLRHRQILFEKQTLDVFDNPHASELVDKLGPDAEYVVFGVVTEYCVKCAAKGLLDRGRKVSVVTDAIETLKSEDGSVALRELQSMGAKLITTDQVLTKIAARAVS
jgi:nicotinamidase/pyrazinamidase